MKRFPALGLPLLLLLGPPAGAAQEKEDREGIEFFEKKIRPVLVDRCYSCHSAEAKKLKGGLYLDTREGVAKGGDNGPSIVAGDPGKSLLIKVISYADPDLKMPPKESERLTAEQVADFEAWVRRGAPDPRRAGAPVAVKPKIDFDAARKAWPFAPVSDPRPPAVPDAAWPRTDVDRFILAKLEEKGLAPGADTDRRTLIRRATFDLIGLPPTPEEIDAFLADAAPDAFAKVVDRLLASPHYGERWGRHWLDVVRYADTAGDNSDYPVPQHYRYRNYVIRSFNEDKPYDRFIREQLAGDLLPSKSEEERIEKLTATGYLANSRRFGSRVDDYPWHLTIEDTIDNLGRTFLGLTVNCSRCHDHKFDPITNEDYYALYGFFASTKYAWPGIELEKSQRDFVPLVAAAKLAELMKPVEEKKAALETKVKQAEADKAAADKLVKEMEAASKKPSAETSKAPAADPVPADLDPETRKKLEEIEAALVQARKTLEFAEAEVRKLETERRELVEGTGLATAKKKASAAAKALEAAKKDREAHAKQPLPYPTGYAVSEGKSIGNAKMQIKGDPEKLGREVARRFPTVLGGQALPPETAGSGRLQLADWLADASNPLTARVMVNRIWAYHFGAGIVRTPSDFGRQGRPPTHPELLDWLARRFIAEGWSVKSMHRLLMLSRAYQLSSRDVPSNSAKDPANEGFWRYNRRRLEAEAIRDAILAVSGALDRTPSDEPHPFPPMAKWDYTQHKPFIAVYETSKRSVYLMTQRVRKHPFYATFDGADPSASTPMRLASTTPLQALFMMNDPFLHEQAKKFAARLASEVPDEAKRIDRAALLLYGRPAAPDERRSAEAYLREAGAKVGAAEAWESYARVLLRTSEYIYLH